MDVVLLYVPIMRLLFRNAHDAKACGMNAITSDENGKATNCYDKCVSCGMCLVNCPFGAISDKSQIYQVIKATVRGKVYAAVAPAFVGQFGPKVTPEKLRAAMKELGFADVLEVSRSERTYDAKQEAEDFLKEVPEELPFMATSCCPGMVRNG